MFPPPPDLGKATRSLARILSNYSPSAALDVGCGSGFLAIVMKRNGTDIVWAVDISEETVECAKQNALQNSIFGSVNVVKSDLLTDIPPSVKFDLIVFHQPYFPARPNEYLAGVPDGGQEIISRFLHQMPAHLNTNGVVIMGHQASVGDEHDPKRIARDMGFSVRTVLKEHYDDTDHYLYEIRERNPG